MLNRLRGWLRSLFARENVEREMQHAGARGDRDGGIVATGTPRRVDRSRGGDAPRGLTGPSRAQAA